MDKERELDKEKERLLDNILKDNIFKNNPLFYSTIPISDIEVKDDGEKIDLNDFQDWYVWNEKKEKEIKQKKIKEKKNV